MGPAFLVDIAPHGDQLWHVVWWTHNSAFPPYHVDKHDIEQTAAAIRGALENLVTRSTEGALARGNREAAIPALNELLRQGHRLYRLLFRDTPRDAQDVADRVKAMLAKQPGRPHIWFKVSPSINVPWALMATTGVPSEPNDGSPAAYRDVWALRYTVATLYKPTLAPDDFEASYPAAEFDALIGVDPTFQEKLAAHLDAHCPEAELFAQLKQPVYDPRALLAEWKSRESRLGLLYLYCHASPKTLGFSYEDLQSVDFTLDYEKRTVPPPCLVFLNGCHTAAGRFLVSTGQRGFCGLVGVETVVPYVFAHRFGAALIASLYNGETLARAIDRLRVQHWPLSLVYGLYAYPFLRLVPASTLRMPPLPDHNYSDLAVGDETM